MRILSHLSCTVLALAGIGLITGSIQAAVDLIPRPVRITQAEGAFTVTPATKIAYAPGFDNAAAYLAERLGSAFDKPVAVEATDATQPADGGILFAKAGADSDLGYEGYTLDATSNGVVIRSCGPAGAFYGAITLLQLMPSAVFRKPAIVDCVPGGTPKIEHEREWDQANLSTVKPVERINVPCVSIWDKPRFAWRGLLIDASRFYYTIDELKHYVDYMAIHKLNRLQIHLTDCDGFRMEIKRYSKLISVGARNIGRTKDLKRVLPDVPGKEEGYYYTQDELKGLVEYAAKRHIVIVPEIEMPGHSGAITASYPEMLCEKGRPDTPLRGSEVCPGKESTYEFLFGVLDEVMEIFPGQYVHMGGDECDHANWVQCPRCKERMEKEGLETPTQLHGYFVGRIADYVHKKGRTLVGWDEILESGAKEGAIGMYWRSGTSDKIVENAARLGQKLVMTPTAHCYFDYPQSADFENEPVRFGSSVIDTRRTYTLEPIPDYLEPENHHIVLGAQANLWGERIRTFPHALYMTWPRGCALAEVVWSPAEGKDYEDFYRRLNETHLKRLDAMGVRYREPREADRP